MPPRRSGAIKEHFFQKKGVLRITGTRARRDKIATRGKELLPVPKKNFKGKLKKEGSGPFHAPGKKKDEQKNGPKNGEIRGVL